MFNALRAYTSLAFTKSKRSGELFAHYSDPRSRCIQFAIARFVLSLTLVLSIYATNTNVNTFPIVGGRGLALQIAALYGLSALASIWTLNYSKWVWRAILFTQLLIDFTLLPLLLSELGGGLSTYSILLFIPIAASATLFTWPATLGVAAVSTLFLLSNAVWMQWFRDIAVDWIAVGLYGMGGFMVVVGISGIVMYQKGLYDFSKFPTNQMVYPLFILFILYGLFRAYRGYKKNY